jgi:hypothetical protein
MKSPTNPPNQLRARKRGILSVLSITACLLTQGQLSADEVTRWNEIATRASFQSGLGLVSGNPLFESRVYAMMHAAIHDALNSIERRYEPYALSMQVNPAASPQAAVATAAHDVLVDQFNQLASYGVTSQQTFLDAMYTASLAAIPNGAAKDLGIGIGRAAALAILNLRANDGWNAEPPMNTSYPQGTAPGEYRFTPGTPFAFLTYWGTVRPFALTSSTQYQPPNPYPIDSKRYTRDYNEIKALGGDGITTTSARTADQTEIALFWLESSPQGWNRIARRISPDKGVGLWENGRLFALLNFGMADGYIANFESKYHYNYWRPVTAVQLGNDDGNPDTIGDPNWTPLVQTPPVPDYASGHSVQGGVASQILERFFKTDKISFQTCSTSLPARTCNDPNPVMRSFSTLSDAAEENGLSRIYIGFHFRNAVDEGIKHGHKIGQYIFTHVLRPAH